MCDGVQFEDRSPVLYLVWDAISGEPLFGERKLYRGEEDLVPLLERVRAMNVPVIGIVTDKEKGLVPAVEHVFPGVPYQFCQTHFLKNCGKPLQDDLTALQGSVRRRADEVREIGKQLAVGARASASATTATSPGSLPGTPTGTDVASANSPTDAPANPLTAPLATPPTDAPANPPTDEQALVREICEIVRVNSRVSGKAPQDPPELKRHLRLEQLRDLVNDAQPHLARGANRRANRTPHRHHPRARTRDVQRTRPGGPPCILRRRQSALRRLPAAARRHRTKSWPRCRDR
jgi:hypothetical protein